MYFVSATLWDKMTSVNVPTAGVVAPIVVPSIFPPLKLILLAFCVATVPRPLIFAYVILFIDIVGVTSS